MEKEVRAPCSGIADTSETLQAINDVSGTCADLLLDQCWSASSCEIAKTMHQIKDSVSGTC